MANHAGTRTPRHYDRALLRFRLPGKHQILGASINDRVANFVDSETIELTGSGHITVSVTVK